MPAKLTPADVPVPTFQSALRSSVVRTAQNALYNKVNELVDGLAAVSIGTTNAETTAARPYHTALLERLDSMWKGQPNYRKYGGAVTVDTNVAKVDIAFGEAKVDGADVKWSSVVSAALVAAASGKHRVDVVVANSDSSITIVTGGETTNSGTSPDVPTISTAQLALAYLYIDDSAINLTGKIYTNFSLYGGTLNMLFIPNDVKYVALNDTTASFQFDTAWTSDISLVGTMQLIVTHHSADCTLTFINTAYHINVNGAVANQTYVLPMTATKRTIFQVYFDGTSVYVMENPFYVVA